MIRLTPAQSMTVTARRTGDQTAEAMGGSWRATLSISPTGPAAAPKPPEAIVAALAACLIAGVQREGAAAGLRIDGIEAVAEATRVMGEGGPSLGEFRVLVTVTSPEPEARLHQMFGSLDSAGVVTNTLKLGREIVIDYRIVASAS